MKTKKEQELIKLRAKRLKKFNCWDPSQKEFDKVVYKAWVDVLNNIREEEDLIKKIMIVVESVAKGKYYWGLHYCFGRFIGKPLAKEAVIVIYKTDIMSVNFWQKDLVKEHLYYILQHELDHYLGMKHGKPGSGGGIYPL